MRRIDHETREAISELAVEIEADGFEVNRRAVAREFGVSPQTVARILDGSNARRGVATAEPSPGRPGIVIAALGVGVIALWAWLRRRQS